MLLTFLLLVHEKDQVLVDVKRLEVITKGELRPVLQQVLSTCMLILGSKGLAMS